MVAGSSTNDVEVVRLRHCLQQLRVDVRLVIITKVFLNQLPHYGRLFINFLQHVVWVSPLISRVFIHVHGEGIPLLFVPGEVLDGNMIRLNNH